MTATLTIQIDVTDLTDEQVGLLRASLWAQTEAHPDGDYPDVEVMLDVVSKVDPAGTRVLVALDVTEADAADADDLLASVRARLEDEAGYLDDGTPIIPTGLTLALTDDGTPLQQHALAGAYEVGIDGYDPRD